MGLLDNGGRFIDEIEKPLLSGHTHPACMLLVVRTLERLLGVAAREGKHRIEQHDAPQLTSEKFHLLVQ